MGEQVKVSRVIELSNGDRYVLDLDDKRAKVFAWRVEGAPIGPFDDFARAELHVRSLGRKVTPIRRGGG